VVLISALLPSKIARNRIKSYWNATAEEVFVGGKKHVEAGPLRLGQQFAVGECIPSSIFGLDDGVTRKKPGNAAGRYEIK
jgi:hypothetical protein